MNSAEIIERLENLITEIVDTDGDSYIQALDRIQQALNDINNDIKF